MISSKKYIDETLKRYQLQANKALGQNFLAEEKIAEEIVNNLNIDRNSVVIEIGPGMGALTELLLQKAKKVYAFEIDANMVRILQDTFREQENLVLIHQDFLKVDFDAFLQTLKRQKTQDIHLISNLPYYITSKILNKVLWNNQYLESIVAMMQKEVGQKLIRPEGKEKNALTMLLSYCYDTKILKYVSKNSYLPRPEIDSVVLQFKKISPRYPCDELCFMKVCDALYQNRRKTIFNNLKNLFDDKEQAEQCLLELNLSNSLRVEQLKIQEIIEICNYIGQKSSSN